MEMETETETENDVYRGPRSGSAPDEAVERMLQEAREAGLPVLSDEQYRRMRHSMARLAEQVEEARRAGQARLRRTLEAALDEVLDEALDRDAIDVSYQSLMRMLRRRPGMNGEERR